MHNVCKLYGLCREDAGCNEHTWNTQNMQVVNGICRFPGLCMKYANNKDLECHIQVAKSMHGLDEIEQSFMA